MPLVCLQDIHREVMALAERLEQFKKDYPLRAERMQVWYDEVTASEFQDFLKLGGRFSTNVEPVKSPKFSEIIEKNMTLFVVGVGGVPPFHARVVKERMDKKGYPFPNDLLCGSIRPYHRTYLRWLYADNVPKYNWYREAIIDPVLYARTGRTSIPLIREGENRCQWGLLIPYTKPLFAFK